VCVDEVSVDGRVCVSDLDRQTVISPVSESADTCVTAAGALLSASHILHGLTSNLTQNSCGLESNDHFHLLHKAISDAVPLRHFTLMFIGIKVLSDE